MEVISAKCASCGHVVRVPESLGGKRAKCPECASTITIPTPDTSGGDLVSDEDLPVVAETDDITEDDGEPAPAEEEEEAERPRSRRREVGRRGRGGRHQPAGGRGGRQGRGGYGGGRRKKGSPAILIITIVIALALVAVIIVVATSESGGPAKNQKKDKAVEGPVQPARTEEDASLQSRCEAYVRAVNGQDPQDILNYYAHDQKREGLRAANRLVNEKVIYENALVTSASASTKTTVMSYEVGGQKQEKTLNWRKVDGKWYLTAP